MRRVHRDDGIGSSAVSGSATHSSSSTCSLSAVIAGAELVGFETRDVESLREHYALTLRAWLSRLERHAREAIALTDERTFRTWRFYMAGSAFGFSSGRLNIVQTLFAKPNAEGRSHVPLRRDHMRTSY